MRSVLSKETPRFLTEKALKEASIRVNQQPASRSGNQDNRERVMVWTAVGSLLLSPMSLFIL